MTKIKLHPHQAKFLDENPNKALLVWDTGLGKSFTAKLWLDKRKGNKLVICPKVIKQDWIDNVSNDVDVLTKEEIKKTDISKYDVLVVDEALYFASPLFTKDRSQMATTLYNLIREKPDINILLATATPVSSSGWNAHTLLTYIGKYIDWKKFRETYFELTSPPFLKGRYGWFSKKDWRKNVRDLLLSQSNIYVASLSDFITDVPEIIEETKKVKLDVKTLDRIKEVDENIEFESDMKRFVEKHKLETGKEKVKAIREIGRKFRKIIVVAKYKDTIAYLEKELSKDREVFVITGEVKDQNEVVRQARESFENYIIIQSQVASGFELSEYPAIIFSQEGYKYSDYVQMKGRNRRVNDLHINYIYYLIGGEKDRQVRKTLAAGEDLILT